MTVPATLRKLGIWATRSYFPPRLSISRSFGTDTGKGWRIVLDAYPSLPIYVSDCCAATEAEARDAVARLLKADIAKDKRTDGTCEPATWNPLEF